LIPTKKKHIFLILRKELSSLDDEKILYIDNHISKIRKNYKKSSFKTSITFENQN